MPIRLCLEPKCGSEQAYRGRCATHSRARERTTHPNRKVYNSAKWRYARRHQLQAHPLCQAKGCGRIATDVDHIVPIEQGGSVWDPENHGSLCVVCHGRKTKREQGATP